MHTFGDSAEYGATSIHHCQACPANSGQDHQLIGVDHLVMQDVDSCKCFMGFENRTDLRGCSNCTNYQIQPEYSDNACGFCPDGHYFVAAYLECTECYIADQKGHDPHVQLVLNSIDPALPWATSAADCICRVGHERLTENNLCTECQAGYARLDNTTRYCEVCAVDTFQNTTAS